MTSPRGEIFELDARSRRSPSYGPVIAAYLAVAGSLFFAVRRRRIQRLPRVGVDDALLLGLGTFKVSRLLTKDKVLQPVRDPFVAHTEPGDGAEVNNEPVGTGIRLALGELLTCPFCVSVWIATAFTASFAIAPRATRLVASGLAAAVVSDASQYAYSGLRVNAQG